MGLPLRNANRHPESLRAFLWRHRRRAFYLLVLTVAIYVVCVASLSSFLIRVIERHYRGRMSGRPHYSHHFDCAASRARIGDGLRAYVARERESDPELEELVRPLFTLKPLVIWTSDHHSAPVHNLRALLQPLGVRFIDHTAYFYCETTCSCEGQDGLRVLKPDNILHLSPELIRRFHREYPPNYPEMALADAFATFHCFGHLELFEPYNKSIIAISTTVYQNCRSPTRWNELNAHLYRVFSRREHVIGAVSHYHREYIRYFTGLTVDYLPALSLYTNASYAPSPTRRSFLLLAQKVGFVNQELGDLWESAFARAYDRLPRRSLRFILDPLRMRYPAYEFADLAVHRGVVHVPYHVSTMSIFEHYRMSIPLFFPWKQLLLDWHLRYQLLYDRTIAGWFSRPTGSPQPAHPSVNPPLAAHSASIPDPNADTDPRALRYWLSLADYYVLPHISYFSSVEELVETLNTVTDQQLQNVSLSMRSFNRESLKTQLRYWRERLLHIAQNSPNRPA